MTDTQQGYAGQASIPDGAGPFNQLYFLVQQMLGRVGTMKLVQIVAVTNDDDLAAVGFVDVLPLVKLVDGLGNTTDQATVFGIPYFRIQGGTNAVIMDPKVGDLGLCIISDRDISAVKSAKEPSPPGSKRRFDLADGVYIGGILNGVPEQYVRFADDLIEVVSPTKIKLSAPTIELVGTAIKANNINLTTHTHTSAAPGNPTGPPLP